MSASAAAAVDRNYPALFLALDEALEAFAAGAPADEALQRSFEGAAEGFGAEKAVMLAVQGEGSCLLRAIASRGLSPQEVRACEDGRSVPGVSSSCIRDALVARSPILVQDPRGLLAGQVSDALRSQPCSVLCAPLCDPTTGEVVAVLYFQNDGIRDAFGEIDRSWIEVYARALGRALAAADGPGR